MKMMFLMNMAMPNLFRYNWLKAVTLIFKKTLRYGFSYELDIIDNNTYAPPLPKIE